MIVERLPSSLCLQCANLIAAKEKKSSTYRSATTLPPLSEEKQAKMKKFTKEVRLDSGPFPDRCVVADMAYLFFR
jgi:hypothetical protein